jgi:hypothetical protein
MIPSAIGQEVRREAPHELTITAVVINNIAAKNIFFIPVSLLF